MGKALLISLALAGVIVAGAAGQVYIQNENAKVAAAIAVVQEQERVASEAAAEKAAAEKAAAEKAAAEKAAAEKVAAEKAAAEKAAAEKAAAEKAAAEKAAAATGEEREPGFYSLDGDRITSGTWVVDGKIIGTIVDGVLVPHDDTHDGTKFKGKGIEPSADVKAELQGRGAYDLGEWDAANGGWRSVDASGREIVVFPNAGSAVLDGW